MASVIAGVTVKAKAEGLNEINKTAGEIHQNLAGAQKAAKGLANTKFAAAAAKRESEDYGVSRSLRPGGTGASARDFAQEAQGLGGLVRLYATYAANIFAVGAAFRALSNAMDTANMVRGLDQLGAASGMALGTLSKRLVVATDGAISLREAMESVAKASSSGMSSENILRMGKVAKQASQALGVDMADAVNRITRGITKLEPELLDEIGIFTRVDSAVKEYAKSTNKAVSSLTDFERRMAFANAVLAEGERKFSAIQIDTNPYTKLLAVTKDLTQNILEVVNVALKPLVSLLSSNPTALLAVIGAIGVKLTRSALPVLTNFKDQLKTAADAASIAQKEKLGNLKSSLTEETRLIVKALDDRAELLSQKQEETADRLAKIAKAQGSKRAQEIARKSLPDITTAGDDNDLSYLDKMASKGTKASKVYEEMATRIRSYKVAEEEFTVASKILDEELNKKHSIWTGIGQVESTYHRETQAARARDLTSQSAHLASTQGFTAGIKKAFSTYGENRKPIESVIQVLDSAGNVTGRTSKVTTAGLSAMSAGFQLFKNVAVSSIAAIGLAIGAFMPYIEILAIVATGLTVLYQYLSNTKKESKDTSDAIDSLTSSGENLYRTLENINKKPILDRSNVQSIDATANALSGLSNELRNVFETSYKEIEAMNWADKLVDILWPGSVEATMVNKVSRGMFRAFQAVDENSPAGKQASESIKAILKVDDLSSFEKVSKAFDKLTDGNRKAAIDAITKEMTKLGTSMQISAAKGTELVDSFKKVEESRNKVINSFSQKDPLSEYGQTLIDTMFKLDRAIQDPVQKFNAIKEFSKEFEKLSTATVEEILALQKLAQATDSATRASEAYKQNRKETARVEAELSKYISQAEIARAKAGKLTNTRGSAEIKRLIEELRSLSEKGNGLLEIKLSSESTIEKMTGTLNNALIKSFKEGANAVSVALGAEWAKAGVATANAYASILSGTETGIRMKADSDKSVIAAQIAQIQSQQALTIAVRENTLAVEQESIDRQRASGNTDKNDTAVLNDRQIRLNQKKEALELAKSGSTKGMYSKLVETLTKAGAKMSELDQESLSFARNMEASMAAVAALRGQQAAIDIGAQNEILKKQQADLAKIKEDEIKKLTTQRQQLDVLKDILGDSNSAYLAEKQRLDTSILQKQQLLEISKIDDRIAQFRKVPTAGAKKEIELLEIEKARLKQQQEGAITLLATQQTEEKRIQQAKEEQKLADYSFERSKRALDIQSEALSSEEAKIEVLKTQNLLGAELAIIYEKILKTRKADQAFNSGMLEAEKQRADAQRAIDSKKSGLAKFGSVEYDTPAQAEARRIIIAEEQRINEIYNSRVGVLSGQRALIIDNANAVAVAAQQQLIWNEALATAKSLTESLGIVFKDLGSSIGNALESLVTFASTTAKNQNDTIAKQKILDDLWAKEGVTYDEISAAEKSLGKQKDKNTEDEIKGITTIAGSAKKMFKEKTAGYKLLSAVEKASAAVSMVLEAQKLATTIANVAKQVTALTPAIMGKFFADLGPWGWAAGAAAIAAIGGSFSGGGGVPAGMTAEEQQNVQGTGQDYINGQLVSNGGGVLGDITATSKDISDSLSLIEENTTNQILFDSKAVDYLRAIRTNTEGLAAAISSVPGITGGISGFGTREKSNPGFLGLFASSTSIIDSGIRAAGILGDILKDPAAYFKQYETVQKTKSGFLGIGGGTSTKVNTKPLEQEITEYIVGIFENAKKTVVELGTVFGLDTTKAVDDLVSSLSVDFQVSAKGLKGDELIEAIMAETGVTMNQLVSQVYPFLEDFQKVGEGMLTTLTRVNTEIQVVNGLFNQMGVDFAKKFTPGMNVLSNAATKAAKQATADAKARLDAAKTASATESGYIDVIEIRGDVETTYRKQILETEAEKQELIDATNAYNTALKAENDAKYASIRASVQVYDALVESEGGLDRFTERANFFIDNFVPSSVRLGSALNTVETGMAELGYSGIKTREQFYNVVTGLDLSTEAGRATYSSLMDLAPAFDIIADKVDELAGSVKLSTESLATIIVDGYMNGVDGAQIGKMVANTIQRGVQQALIQGVANQIASLISAQIVNPILQSIVAGGVVSASVSKATMASVVDQARAMISALADVFNSPEFKQLLADLGNLNFNFGNIGVTPAYQYEQNNSDAGEDARNEALKAVDDAFNALKRAIDAEKKLIQEQIKLAEENLEKINAMLDVLDTNIKELRGSVDSTAALQAAQGQDFITQALQQAMATGALPDADKLAEAIGAVRAGIEQGNYDSKFAEDRAKLILAGELQRLKDLGLEQKTDAELQLEALQEQLTALDAILDTAQAQVDAIKGVDNSILSVSDALAKLATAIAGVPGGGGGGTNPPPGGQNPGIGVGGTIGSSIPNKGFQSGLTKDYRGEYNSGSVRQQDGKYYYTSTVTDAGGFAGAQAVSDTLTSSRPWTTVGYASNNPDVVQYYNQNKAIIAQLGQASSLADYLNYHFITYGISENRKFAKGGIFDNAIVNAPTLFDASMMGEAGPEAIMPLGKLPDGSLGVRGHSGDNAELVAELRSLKAELNHMKQYVAKTSTSSEESRKLLDEVVRGGTAITVESEIASY